jgi:large subunit ribosomal protein L30e
MALRESIDNIIRYIARTGKVVEGFNQTLKYIKLGKLKYVVVASNAPEEMENDVLYYAKLSGIPVVEYPGTNRDLGTLIGKPFSVAFLGVIDLGQVSEDMLKPFIKM